MTSSCAMGGGLLQLSVPLSISATCHSHNLEDVAGAEGRWHRQYPLKRATQCNRDLRDFLRRQFCGCRGSLRSKARVQEAAPRLRAIETQHVFSFVAVNR